MLKIGKKTPKVEKLKKGHPVEELKSLNKIRRKTSTIPFGYVLDTEDEKHLSPIPEDSINKLYDATDCVQEGSKAHKELENKKGFTYRGLLGEMMYCYTTCRPDIGYAITTLSKFSVAPAPIHFDYLKGVAIYLKRTKNWGIRFHQTSPSSFKDLKPG